MTLARLARDVDPAGVVAQRLKRMPQIVRKLGRHGSMNLSQMQDIAGCRAVLSGPEEIDAVHSAVADRWSVARTYDYREDGRPDTGYRGLHLVVADEDPSTGTRRSVEIQLRTRTQHRWATAVERTGARLGVALKEAAGPDSLLEFFRLASAVLQDRSRQAPPDSVQLSRMEGLRDQIQATFIRAGASS